VSSWRVNWIYEGKTFLADRSLEKRDNKPIPELAIGMNKSLGTFRDSRESFEKAIDSR